MNDQQTEQGMSVNLEKGRAMTDAANAAMRDGKPKRWAQKFEICTRCGTNATPHHARGLCAPCYRLIYRNLLIREHLRRTKRRLMARVQCDG